MDRLHGESSHPSHAVSQHTPYKATYDSKHKELGLEGDVGFSLSKTKKKSDKKGIWQHFTNCQEGTRGKDRF